MFTAPRAGLSIAGGLVSFALLSPAGQALAQRPSEPAKGQQTLRGMLQGIPQGQNPYGRLQHHPHANLFFAFDTDPLTGMALAEVDEPLRAHLDLPDGQGVVVASVAKGSPADEAGVAEGDILLELAGAPLAKPGDAKKALDGKDGPQDLKLIHKGKARTVELRPPTHPAAGMLFGAAPAEEPAFYIGLPVATVEPALRAQLDLPEGQGLLAAEVTPDSPAAKAGLKANDILLTFAGEPIADREGLVKRIQENGDKPAKLELIRAGERTTVEITPVRREGARGPATGRGAPRQGWTYDWQMVRPGVFQGQADVRANVERLAELYRGAPPVGVTIPGAGSGEVEKKLDALTEEVRRLRESVSELREILSRRD